MRDCGRAAPLVRGPSCDGLRLILWSESGPRGTRCGPQWVHPVSVNLSNFEDRGADTPVFPLDSRVGALFESTPFVGIRTARSTNPAFTGLLSMPQCGNTRA